MNVRYSRLYTLPENLYTVGAPVIIAAGTLLKDNQTGKIVAQLKLQSISNKAIKAVKVKLDLFDTAENSLEESVVHDYLDLNVSRDAEFGQKNPVMVPNIKARSYKASVTEVVFSDRSVWTGSVGNWEPLSKPSRLVFQDYELQRQYEIKFGGGSVYETKAEKDLWYCTCGALNHDGEVCHVCHNTLLALQNVDMSALEKEKNARLAEEARVVAEREKKAAEEQAARKAAAEAAKKRVKRIIRVAIPSVCVFVIIVLLFFHVIIPNRKYNNAISLQEEGKTLEAALAFGQMTGYKDAWERSSALWSEITVRETVNTGYRHAVGLCSDGTVVATGDNEYGQCNVENWTDIVAISADGGFRSFGSDGGFHTVGLRTDGTVVATGWNGDGRCNVYDWTDIVAICTGLHTVGLRADGTVVATGWNGDGACNVEDWTDIVAVSVGGYHTVGLCADGTVVATGVNEDDQCDVGSWADIVAISAGDYHTVGLRADGTVVATGENLGDVDSWTDIVAISAGGFYTVGLRADGTVVATGNFFGEEFDVSGWTDIVAVSTAGEHTVGLRADGTVVASGNNDYGQCDVEDWTDIKLPD